MKNKTALISLCLCLGILKMTAQTDSLALNILQKSKAAIEQIKTLRYDAAYHFIIADNKGNEHKTAKAAIKRVPKDILFLLQDSTASFSDDGVLYQKLIWKDSTMTFMTKEQSLRYVIKAKRDYTIDAYSDTNRLNMSNLGKLSEPISDVVFDNKRCYKLVFSNTRIRQIRNQQDITTTVNIYYIEKASFLPIRHELQGISYGQTFIYELHNIEINPNLPDTLFDLRLSLPSYISVKPFVTDSVRVLVRNNDSNKPLLTEHTKAPDWSVKDILGNTIRSSDLKGKVVLIDFWFINCGPCKKAIPFLNQLYADYKDKGLVVLGFNFLDLKIEKYEAYQKENAVNYPLVLCPESVTNNFRVQAAPTLYLIDKEGNIVHCSEGFSQETFAKLAEKIKALLAL